MDVSCPLTSFLTLACGVRLYASALDPIPFNYEKVYIIQFLVDREHMMGCVSSAVYSVSQAIGFTTFL